MMHHTLAILRANNEVIAPFLFLCLLLLLFLCLLLLLLSLSEKWLQFHKRDAYPLSIVHSMNIVVFCMTCSICSLLRHCYISIDAQFFIIIIIFLLFLPSLLYSNKVSLVELRKLRQKEKMIMETG